MWRYKVARNGQAHADGHAEPGIVLTARRTRTFLADATRGEGLLVFTCLTICSRIDHVSFDGERPLCGRSAVDAEGPLVADSVEKLLFRSYSKNYRPAE